MPSLFIEFMGNTEKIKIIDFLLENGVLHFTKRDAIRITRVSKTEINKIFNYLIKHKVILQIKQASKFYKINRESNIAKSLINLDWAIIKSYPPFA